VFQVYIKHIILILCRLKKTLTLQVFSETAMLQICVADGSYCEVNVSVFLCSVRKVFISSPHR